uniref:Uncharacterized protein n=1 Tax=Pristionchus pacificus TaxID=54126 RepID=A0A2A6BIU8_PRIPA|eukprot:PDM65721.1 hypothetical protein PRIPAC_45635 [Pristionchus pacificus]
MDSGYSVSWSGAIYNDYSQITKFNVQGEIDHCDYITTKMKLFPSDWIRIGSPGPYTVPG